MVPLPDLHPAEGISVLFYGTMSSRTALLPPKAARASPLAPGAKSPGSSGSGANLPDTVRHLARLLRQENEALSAMDFAGAGALLAPKHAAATALAAAWRTAIALDAPAEDLRRLGELAEQNRILVNRAMGVQRRVLELVAKTARDSGKKQQGSVVRQRRRRSED